VGFIDYEPEFSHDTNNDRELIADFMEIVYHARSIIVDLGKNNDVLTELIE
jgi:hypothetical protein